VGRFLEHARVAAFRRDGAWEVWCGSADGMPRNFDRRHELLFPLEDPRARDLVLRALRSQLQDDVNAFVLDVEGHETKRWGGEHDCQRTGPRRAVPLAPPAQPPAPQANPAADPGAGAAAGNGG
jgi:polyphosphate kinase